MIIHAVVSSGKTNDDFRIFVQHCDKGQRTNAKFPKSNAKLHPIVPMPNVWHQVGTRLAPGW